MRSEDIFWTFFNLFVFTFLSIFFINATECTHKDALMKHGYQEVVDENTYKVLLIPAPKVEEEVLPEKTLDPAE